MELVINSSLNYGKNSDEYIFLSPTKSKYLSIRSPQIVQTILDIVAINKRYEDIIKNINNKIESIELLTMLKFLIEKEVIVEYVKEKEDIRFGNQIDYLIYKKNNIKDGIELNKKLSQLKVLIIGAGAIGSNLAVLLASMGITSIEVIDGDAVEYSNLTRQFFYTEEDVQNKTLKVNSLGRVIQRLNSQVKYYGTAEFISENYNLKNDKPDIIIQTGDKPYGKLSKYVSKIAKTNKIPTLFIYSNLIGPFINYQNNFSLDDFEKWVDIDSQGMHKKLVENFSLTCHPKYASIAHGSLVASNLIIDFILEFTDSGSIDSLKDSVYALKEGEIILIKGVK